MSSTPHPPEPGDRTRLDLRADCARCFALCCVALPLSRSADFAIDKPAGQPCPNLGDLRCGIHARLRDDGFPGCSAYDCFGAGQQVSQVTFGGTDWRHDPASAHRMFAVLPVMQQLHELRWHLTEALTLPQADPIHMMLAEALDDTERLAAGSPDALLALDLGHQRQRVGALLQEVSRLVRAVIVGRQDDLAGTDLAGADLRGRDLRGACLRGALLIGADLRSVDLRLADLLGADLRGADLRGADLRESIFLTQSQVGAALGDEGTQMSDVLDRPAHWSIHHVG